MPGASRHLPDCTYHISSDSAAVMSILFLRYTFEAMYSLMRLDYTSEPQSAKCAAHAETGVATISKLKLCVAVGRE